MPQTLGLNLKEQVDAGMIQVLYDSPQELEIDAHFDLIIRTIEKHKMQRLLIDGMTSYSNALGDQALYRDFIHSLVAYSKHHLMTTFFNYENPELFGVTHYMPDYAISSIVDNLILLNFVELGTSLRRAITVAKARGSEHQFVTREFTIGPGGISLLPIEEGKGLPVLPFQSYYGLLSRAPTRLSPDLPRSGEGGARRRSNVTLLFLACNTERKPCPSRSIVCWSTTATKTMASPLRSRSASSCRRPSVPTSWTRRSGKTGWPSTPVARTSRWPSPMRPVA